MNQRLTIFFSVALGLVLTGIWLYIVDLGEMIIIMKKIRIWLFLPLGALFIFIYFLRGLRWKVILSPVENISVGESFTLSMTNYFINFLIPVHAGEVVKSLLLKKMKGTPVSKSLLTACIDKIADLLLDFMIGQQSAAANGSGTSLGRKISLSPIQKWPASGPEISDITAA